MGLTVDRRVAERVLTEAAVVAVSDGEVPAEWVEWTRRVDAAPAKTYTVALGTALLAKATEPAVDALALKATSGDDAYSARSVAHGVLVPGSVRYGYDLRATGREPLNNQPFFRYDRIDTIDRVRDRAHLATLTAACRAVNDLDARGAAAALAAFLRVRLEAARARRAVAVRGGGLSLSDLVLKTEVFVASDPEGGRRGQAFVAAAFDLTSSEVRSSRVNDPSRRMPGDVQLLADGVPQFAVEVRQKLVTHEDALRFGTALRAGGVANGMIAMLAPDQPQLSARVLLAEAERLNGVFLTLAHGVLEVLAAATVRSGLPPDVVLHDFPRHMLRRLQEIEVSDAGVELWAGQFS